MSAPKVSGEPHNHLPPHFYTMLGARTTLTTKQLRETLLATDGWIMARGQMRVIKSKRIGPGVYEVWSEERP